MFDTPLYFCVGEYRDGKRLYRVFPIDSVGEAHRVAASLGYRVLLDEAYKSERIQNMEQRFAEAILTAVHVRLHGVENIVSCIRKNLEAAKALERHFLEAEIDEYFPKLLVEPFDLGASDQPVNCHRRPCPWMIEHVILEMKASDEFPKVAPLQVLRLRYAAIALQNQEESPKNQGDFLADGHYDGFVTAVSQDGDHRAGYDKCASHFYWMLKNVMPKLDDAERNVERVMEYAVTSSSSGHIVVALDRIGNRIRWIRKELSCHMTRFIFFNPANDTATYRLTYDTMAQEMQMYAGQLAAIIFPPEATADGTFAKQLPVARGKCLG